jgi:hypothetical protein
MHHLVASKERLPAGAVEQMQDVMAKRYVHLLLACRAGGYAAGPAH